MAEAAASQSSPDFYFNPIDPSFRDNPYPHYPMLRSGPPRKFNVFIPTTLIARYDDCISVLRDPEHFSSQPPPVLAQLRAEFGPFAGATTMLDSDPPVHTRLRKLVNRAFTPRRIREMEPRIRSITDELLDNIARGASFDLMNDFAGPLPVIVIAEMLGVPTEDHAKFKIWSNQIIEGGRGTLRGNAPGAEVKASAQELRAFLADQIERRRRDPGEDLITALVQAHDEDGALAADELLAFVVLLLLAGNETTTNLIGNGMLALGKNPEQLELLRRSPELMPRAIEEMLRYDGPVQATARVATENFNLGGSDLTPGTVCFVILAAANRDPAQFENPDKFDVTREPKDHVAFGEGIHFCIGAPLARLEGAIAIGELLRRFPKARLTDPDAKRTYKGSFFLRGLTSLPMTLE